MNGQEAMVSLFADIEASTLTADEKQELYGFLADGVRELVYPIIIKHMPEEKIEALYQNQETKQEAVAALFGEAIKDGVAFGEIEALLVQLCTIVREQLQKSGQIQV